METLKIIEQVEIIYSDFGNPIIFISSFIETLPIGFLIPGGLIIALGGFYSYGKSLNLMGVILSGTAGMTLAFLLGYLLGEKTGLRLVKLLKQEKNAEMAKILLKNQGAAILTTSLMGNLTRFWVAYVAGSQKYNFLKFLLYGIAASLTWNSLFVTVGYLAGSERQQLETGIAKLGILSYGLVIIALIIISWSIKKEYKKLSGSK